MTTLQTVWKACLSLDWHGKDEKQAQNAYRLMDHLGHQFPVNAIDEQVIDGLLLWLRESGPRGNGCGNSTLQRYLSALSVLLKRAQRMGLLDRMPLLPERRTIKSPEPRELVIKDEWFRSLLAGLEEREMQLLCRFLWLSGCRVSEALSLTWDRVDDNWIQFTRTKGNVARKIPVDGEMREVLRELYRPMAVGLFSYDYDQVKYRFNKAKQRVCSLLALSEQTRKEWTIHSLRHTCLTRLAEQGMSAPMLQQWAGHKTLAVTQRYVHASASSLEAWIRCRDAVHV